MGDSSPKVVNAILACPFRQGKVKQFAPIRENEARATH
jgi:hypothetical protein